MYTKDPYFRRAGAIATVIFMCVVLAALTIDTLKQIAPGGARVPAYDLINSAVTYQYDTSRGEYAPKSGGEELIFCHKYSADEATAPLAQGKIGDPEPRLHRLSYFLRQRRVLRKVFPSNYC